MWDSSNMTMLYDSGDDLETHASSDYSKVFNGDCYDDTNTPEEEADTRSDDMVSISCTSRRIRIDKSSTSGVFREPRLLPRPRRSRAIVLRYYGVIIATRHIRHRH